MSIDAYFDGKVFVPDGPVDLPVGHKVRVEIEAGSEHETALTELLKKLQQFPENPDWPPDGAAQHDHYLYGTPKRP